MASLRWSEIADHGEWDAALARLGGHPLQSALWGEARRRAEGIDFHCLGLRKDGVLSALARVETRKLPLLGTAAWIPRGPVAATADDIAALHGQLRQLGHGMVAASSWQRVQPAPGAQQPRTMWLDLRLGHERLQQNLDSQWRYGARRALREGVLIGPAAAGEVDVFFRLCASISQAKGFRLPGSLPLLQQLLLLSQAGAPVQAHLLVARHQGELAAGAFVMVAGKHVHYLWGGVDRRHARLRAGEAVQWAVIEWALQQELELYDLEGIDPLNNPGTYEFKKKMGGEEVTLAAETRTALDWRGALAVQALGLRERWQR